ncbi:hypothetical protein AMTR_s00066p00195830 [Amborella trichopoda]|uniref:Aminotransferase-like plant mobile domain-containing protein n=1 Tax=Amborella trichopoda TaxID=13333 RepID=U5DID0_AMBTC|nr:hypothetical protein AMTR_s00066p00195830 [Amborella trichopoda]
MDVDKFLNRDHGRRCTALEDRENPFKIDEKANVVSLWPLTNNDQIDFVKRSGLYPLTIVPMTHHDHDTLSTMIERWRAEANTRHFNVDVEETLPTLEDT